VKYTVSIWPKRMIITETICRDIFTLDHQHR